MSFTPALVLRARKLASELGFTRGCRDKDGRCPAVEMGTGGNAQAIVATVRR